MNAKKIKEEIERRMFIIDFTNARNLLSGSLVTGRKKDKEFSSMKNIIDEIHNRPT